MKNSTMKKVIFTILIFSTLFTTFNFAQYTFDSSYENNIKMIYLHKNYTLLVPLYVYDTKLTRSFLSILKYSGKPIFLPGEKITFVEIKFKNDEIVFKFYSFDRTKKGTIRIKRPINRSELNFLLSKLFSRRSVKDAKKIFIDNLYQSLFLKISNSLSIGEKSLERMVIGNFSIYEELSSKLKKRETEIEILRNKLKKLENDTRENLKEKRSLKREIISLKNQLEALKSKVKILSQNKSETEKMVSNVISYKKMLDAKIKEIALNLGISTEKKRSIHILSEIETSIMNLSISNKTMKAKIKEEGKRINDLQKKLSQLEETLKNIKNEKISLQKKIRILSSSDKNMAKKLISMEREKNIFQSKLLSKKIIKITQRKKVENESQEIKCNILLKEKIIGSIHIKAPLFLKKGDENKVFATVEVKRDKKSKDTTYKKLLKYLKNFPDVKLKMEKTRGKVSLKLIQSPENSNSNTYIWKIKSMEGINTIYLKINGEVTSIDGEKIPIFEIPVEIRPLSIEKAIVSYFQPIPLGIGIILGLLIALPFIIRVRRGNPPKQKREDRSLYFDDKEL